MKPLLLALALLTATPAARAEGYHFLGHGRLVNNDVFWGRLDRWQTASVASSYVWGWDRAGSLPATPGRLLEFRFEAKIIAPETLVRPAPGDRPYANALSFGLHSHFERRGAEVSLGADLAITGDQTGLYRVQDAIHDLMDIAGPSERTRAAGIGNGVHPTLSFEAGRSIGMDGATLRPFVEARLGVETYLRAGADLTIGRVGQGGLLVRDPVTGQRYRAIDGTAPGYSFVIGADHALVHQSAFLPAPNRPLDRTRIRAGLHWDGSRGRGFYGLTWLSPEFAGQDEGQIVGSLRLDFDF